MQMSRSCGMDKKAVVCACERTLATVNMNKLRPTATAHISNLMLKKQVNKKRDSIGMKFKNKVTKQQVV